MTHAEQYSTYEPCAPAPFGKKQRKRVISVTALAVSLGITGAILSSPRAASADQIASDRAQAAAITAKIQATQGQIQSLTDQVQAADYRLTQLSAQIAANQAEVAKDQAEVAKDQAQLRNQAIADYTSSGTSSQITQMFSGNPNTSDVRAEYSSIANGNVTTTIDNLHTAQTQLQSTQSALKQQQGQQVTTRNSLSSAESQANSLVEQDQQTLAGVNADIQAQVKKQQEEAAAAAQAAAAAAFNARVAAAQRAQAGRHRGRVELELELRHRQRHHGVLDGLGSPAGPRRGKRRHPGGREPDRRALRVGRREPGRRLRLLGARPVVVGPGRGLPAPYLGAQYAATTHVSLADIEPGDLLFYGPAGSDHVAMYIGGGEMIEAPQTGSFVHITGVRTGDGFAGVGRVG